MAPWLIALCGFIYLYVAGDLVYHGRYALGVAYQ